MDLNTHFFSSVLNALPEHIVVIDEAGSIRYVNKSWCDFSCSNAGPDENQWLTANYLQECDTSAAHGDAFGEHAAAGIRQVINQQAPDFYLEYPCHSPEKKRWFMMRVNPIEFAGKRYFVISHHNITERKLAEEHIRKSSRLDGLTKIPNRKTFDEFVHSEWLRCNRLNIPITLAMIDIDFFKNLNDRYGHPFGDQCLIKIAASLNEFSRRPSDICARYGGEEFVIVLGGTETHNACRLMEQALHAIHNLNVLTADNITVPITASIGVATLQPSSNNCEQDLIAAADELLYQAKDLGRDRIISLKQKSSNG